MGKRKHFHTDAGRARIGAGVRAGHARRRELLARAAALIERLERTGVLILSSEEQEALAGLRRGAA